MPAMALRRVDVLVLVAVLVLTVVDGASASADNATLAHVRPKSECQEGLILPVWQPQENLSIGDRMARGFAYMVALLYLFLGVSIISDRFMAAIEVITSQEKEVVVKQKGKESKIVVVRVWNETVANLTLMALGSSAPEILLSIIEIWAKDFKAGELGPGTIVGSAAYNLYVIIAICVLVIPDGEVRKIKHLRVFFVTALWSVFAYVWLYVILEVSSRGVVEVWEAFLTFLFFPLTVGTAYIADRRLLFYKYLHKGYRMNKRGMVVQAETGEGDMEMGEAKIGGDDLKGLEEEAQGEEAKAFEQNRREYIACLRELRKRHPTLDLKQLEAMAQEEVLNKGSKSRAFYRVQATRKMLGGSDVMRRFKGVHPQEVDNDRAEPQRRENQNARVFFKPCHYTVPESVGDFEVTVVREGDLSPALLVDFRTEDGSAHAGCDYVGAQGTLHFHEGETSKTFSITVIDDDEFEEDEHFYIRLHNLRLAPVDVETNDHRNSIVVPRKVSAIPELVSPSTATVMILDDDHCGVFGFVDKTVEVVESIGCYELKVKRFSGSRGRVRVPYKTEDGTARAGKEYEHVEGELIFENNETESVHQSFNHSFIPSPADTSLSYCKF